MTRVLFDATRLLLRAQRAAPTGIDRVTMAYGRWLAGRDDLELAAVWGVGGALAPVSRRRFERLLDSAMPYGAPAADGLGESAAWRRLAGALAADLPGLRNQPAPAAAMGAGLWFAGLAARSPGLLRAAAPPAGAIYLNVSHFGLESPALLQRLARGGVRPVILVHDLIPIRHPEFCAPGAAARHARRIDSALAHARLIVVNSSATARDLADYASQAGLPAPKVCVAPLGLEPAFLAKPAPVPTNAPYFVVVGTIEPRKNLAFLLGLWRRLAEARGEATPRLILVGRRGWEYEAVLDHLERSPPVRRLVHEVSDLRDAELAGLIAGAAALLAPSLAEGFDFATLEALSLGTPVIASRIPAHEELAKGARLVDPLDGPAWVAAIEAAASLRTAPPPFRAPTWAEHFEIFGQALAGVARAPGP